MLITCFQVWIYTFVKQFHVFKLLSLCVALSTLQITHKLIYTSGMKSSWGDSQLKLRVQHDHTQAVSMKSYGVKSRKICLKLKIQRSLNFLLTATTFTRGKNSLYIIACKSSQFFLHRAAPYEVIHKAINFPKQTSIAL